MSYVQVQLLSPQMDWDPDFVHCATCTVFRNFLWKVTWFNRHIFGFRSFTAMILGQFLGSHGVHPWESWWMVILFNCCHSWKANMIDIAIVKAMINLRDLYKPHVTSSFINQLIVGDGNVVGLSVEKADKNKKQAPWHSVLWGPNLNKSVCDRMKPCI